MPVTCTPEALAEDAKCFACLPSQQQLAIQTYILTQIAGVAADPDALLASAVAFTTVEPQKLLALQAYLLCQIATT